MSWILAITTGGSLGAALAYARESRQLRKALDHERRYSADLRRRWITYRLTHEARRSRP